MSIKQTVFGPIRRAIDSHREYILIGELAHTQELARLSSAPTPRMKTWHDTNPVQRIAKFMITEVE